MSKMLAGWSVSWLGGLGGTHHHIIHTHRSIIETSRKDLGLATYSVWAALFVRPHNQNAALWWPISIYLLIQQPTRPTTLPILLFGGRWNWISRVRRDLVLLAGLFASSPTPPSISRRAPCVCAPGVFSWVVYPHFCIACATSASSRPAFCAEGIIGDSKSDSAQKGEGFSVMGTANIMLIGGLDHIISVDVLLCPRKNTI